MDGWLWLWLLWLLSVAAGCVSGRWRWAVAVDSWLLAVAVAVAADCWLQLLAVAHIAKERIWQAIKNPCFYLPGGGSNSGSKLGGDKNEVTLIFTKKPVLRK